MTSSVRPFAFISYRRTDSSAASRWLAQSIVRTFGEESVFIDTESIRMSDNFPQRIEEALQSASLLIPVIGPNWLGATDQYKRRRIDIEDDWVRNEIGHAVKSKIRILPVLLSKTPMPEPQALPNAIRNLYYSQAFELRDEHWETDLNLLLTRMSELGFIRISTEIIRYPRPTVSLSELPKVELLNALERLAEWKEVVSDHPHVVGARRSEIHKSYEFASFEDAIAFMSAAAPEISRRQHHPRWQNVWRTVSVWLSTWDIGYKPSQLDIELATYLDELRSQFRPAKHAK